MGAGASVFDYDKETAKPVDASDVEDLAAAKKEIEYYRSQLRSIQQERTKKAKSIDIIHFNDVYNLEMNYDEEPRGGARQFASQVCAYKQELAAKQYHKPLTLFSGDFVGPSLMSSVTQGAHIIDALNAIGTDYGTFGNHELDYGYASLKARLCGHDDDVDDPIVGPVDYPVSQTQWVMGNMTEGDTGLPMGGSRVVKHALFDWGGTYGTVDHETAPMKVGLLAVSENWLTSCSQLKPGELVYEDFVESARTTARLLQQQGADIVIAITHSRFNNDLVLTEAVPEITLLLGGHDHFFKDDLEHRVVKSGEEWRWLSKIRIDIAAGSTTPVVTYTRQEITSDLPEDTQIDALCDKYYALQQKKFLKVICKSAVELHPEEEYVRFKESAICNWVCDVCCEDYSLVKGKQKADICYLQGFYFAGKAAIPPGDFTLGHLMGTFPKSILLCVIELTGEQLVSILNRGVANLPGECGSIGHVNSAVAYTIILPTAQNGADKATVIDVLFEGEPMDLKRVFRVATAAATIATGPKYGFVEFVDSTIIVEEEFASQLADIVIMHCNNNKDSVINPTTGRISIV